MTATSINPSSAKTKKVVGRIPTDSLLREVQHECRAGEPPCKCIEGLKPFEEQTISSIFNTEAIKVYIAPARLQGLGVPEDVCYAIQKQINGKLDCPDVLLIEPEVYEGDGIRIFFEKSAADIYFPCDMVMYREQLRGLILEEVGAILTNLQLTSWYDQVLEEACR
jgi:hypothetical protein